MAKKKSNTNWYFLIAGAFLLYLGLSKNKSSIINTPSKSIIVELSKDIVNVKGYTNKIDYKFWTKEYPNQFNILDGSISRGGHESISNLKGGQKVEILVSELDYSELDKAKKGITVMGIALNGKTLMSESEFSKNRGSYKNRLTIFSAFIGLMLLINGLTVVSKKVNYALVGIFAGAILIMRVFEIGLY